MVRPAALLRIFLSSPGDVSDERALASLVVERLRYDPFIRGRASIDLVAWDQPGGGAPLLAAVTPQASIDAGLPRPSECDIVVVIFWSRVGTPLPYPEYQRPDGTLYESGTAWELEEALSAARTTGLPAVLLYRRTATVLLDPDAADFEARLEQKRRVGQLFERFRNPGTDAITHGYKSYVTPDDFRAELEADLRALAHRLLDASPSPPTAADAARPPAVRRWEGSPFPGLRAFTSADAPIFFGRGREADELARRLAVSRFVAVVGASGSGKSSLVGAGLIPRLAETAQWLLPEFDAASQQWDGLRFTPAELGDDPFVALAVKLAPLVARPPRPIADELRSRPSAVNALLAAALAQRGLAEALVFVDQFEELVTTVSLAHREPFVALLASIAEGEVARAVVTMRADFYHRCVALPALARLLERGQLPVATPTDTLHEMITRPAELAGLEFDEGLPGRMLWETGQSAGALALLAYALEELYRACQGTGRLTAAAYDDLGGVQGAIGARAEDVYRRRLGPAEQAAFGSVFRNLIETDEDGRPARRRTALDQAAPDPASRRVVDVFTEARLLVQSRGLDNEPVVFVAHEALFRSWDRLRLRIELERDDLRLLRQVVVAAHEWHRTGRREAYLWPHERLVGVYEMRARVDPRFDDVTEAFVRPDRKSVV